MILDLYFMFNPFDIATGIVAMITSQLIAPSSTSCSDFNTPKNLLSGTYRIVLDLSKLLGYNYSYVRMRNVQNAVGLTVTSVGNMTR